MEWIPTTTRRGAQYSWAYVCEGSLWVWKRMSCTVGDSPVSMGWLRCNAGRRVGAGFCQLQALRCSRPMVFETGMAQHSTKWLLLVWPAKQVLVALCPAAARVIHTMLRPHCASYRRTNPFCA